MKTHDQKMAEKAEHEKELERNDLYTWLTNTWTRLKSGQVLSSRFALIALVVGVAIGLAIYLLNRRGSTDTQAWVTLQETVGVEKLSEFAKTHANTLPGKVARLQIARQQLGPLGVNQLSNINPDTRGKAIKSIEDAREEFTKLADDFGNDLALKAQAIDGAAHAELALVGIPKEGKSLQSADFRGTVDKAAELFRKYATLVGEPAGDAAKKMAEQLESKKQEVLQLGSYLNTRLAPTTPLPDIKLPPSLTPEPNAPK